MIRFSLNIHPQTKLVSPLRERLQNTPTSWHRMTATGPLVHPTYTNDISPPSRDRLLWPIEFRERSGHAQTQLNAGTEARASKARHNQSQTRIAHSSLSPAVAKWPSIEVLLATPVDELSHNLHLPPNRQVSGKLDNESNQAPTTAHGVFSIGPPKPASA